MDYRFALIDSSHQMRFHLRLDRCGAAYQSLFEGYPEASLLDIAPLLIDLSHDDQTGRNVLADAMRLGALKPCVSLIAASRPLADIAGHLRQFHQVKVPNNREMIIRWYDGRIDRFGKCQQATLPADDAHHDGAFPLPVHLDEKQIAALEAATEADGMIGGLQAIMPKLRHVPYRVVHPFIEAHLRAARQHGLSDVEDLVEYLILAFQTSGRFIDHPQAAQRLSMPANAHGDTFARWAGGLGGEVAAAGTPLWEAPDEQEDAR
ncbi:DUF4123 domain-containing protein [Cupriavidus sp. 2KB_3]|uniref:DUF4123 domain-containing protein n=1 Tax=Cupriavidus TaxID=106589 RepID=UPI0011EBA36E|nr:DUF4123 domain-containing protein [Cupriavidus campinensis]